MPDIGVTVAGIAVAASLGLLLVYLNRFTHNLRPVAVAALVGGMGQEVLADGSRSSGWATTLSARPDPRLRRAGPVVGPAGRRRAGRQPAGSWSPRRSVTAARSCSPARSATS